jgi:hypothetical protein
MILRGKKAKRYYGLLSGKKITGQLIFMPGGVLKNLANKISPLAMMSKGIC